MALSWPFAPTKTRVARTHATMAASSFAITVVDADESVSAEALVMAQRLDALWNPFDPGSDITRLNIAEGEPRRVDSYTTLLIQEMRDAHCRTAGDFDPTLLPALVARGYGSSRQPVTRSMWLPESACSPGDLRGVRVRGDIVTMPLGTTLDAGGIGQGLAGDLAVAVALGHGARGAITQFGGDVVAAGLPPDGGAWRIGVEDPFRPGALCDVVHLVDGAVATSSTHKRRWRGPGGRLAHHLIDPRTGESVDTNVHTVTVIADSGARADSLTKPGFLRPVAEFLEWLPDQAAAGLVITADGTQHRSANWDDHR